MSRKSSSNETQNETKQHNQIWEDVRRLKEFFSSGNDVEVRSEDSKASLASGKKIDTPLPSSSSSSSSPSTVRSGIVLPVESGSSQPETVHSSRSSDRTVQHISSGSSQPETIQHISSGSSNKSHISITSK